jgi:hypothetical protein
MTFAGMIIMGLSVGSVTLLFGFCLWKVFTTPEPQREHLHAFEGEVPDPHRDE